MDLGKNMMMKCAAVSAAVILVVAGCGKRGEGDGSDPAVAAAKTVASATGQVDKLIKDMSPEDVIVTVAGVSFTKGDLDRQVLALKNVLDKDVQSPPQQKAAFFKQMLFSSVPSFVSSQLLVADAKQKGVLDPSTIDKTVEKKIAELAEKTKKKVSALYAQHPGGEERLKRDITDSLWIEALIASKIPPKTVVDNGFIAATRSAIQADNDATMVTNNMKRAQLREIRRASLAGQADFGEWAEKISECDLSKPGKKGYWGVFYRSDFESPKLRAAVFSLKEGEISEVHEDDEGYQIVRVNKRIAEQRNDKGVVVEPEAVECSRVFLAKLPLLEFEPDEALRKNLQAQMQQQAVSEYVENLRTNSTFVVTYPHGTNLFGHARPGILGGAMRTSQAGQKSADKEKAR